MVTGQLSTSWVHLKWDYLQIAIYNHFLPLWLPTNDCLPPLLSCLNKTWCLNPTNLSTCQLAGLELFILFKFTMSHSLHSYVMDVLEIWNLYGSGVGYQIELLVLTFPWECVVRVYRKWIFNPDIRKRTSTANEIVSLRILLTNDHNQVQNVEDHQILSNFYQI